MPVPLDASSSRREVLNAYLDNVGYATQRSVAQAQLFERACRLLLSMPEETGDRDGTVRMRLMQYERDLLDVVGWIRENAPSVASVAVNSSVTLVSFNNCRD